MATKQSEGILYTKEKDKHIYETMGVEGMH